MNIDQSIHRMAMRESESLGLAQVVIVKKRQELDLRLQRQRIAEGSATTRAGIEKALDDMQEESERRSREPQNDAGVRIDKTA
jgi:hypothetical protein